MSRYIPTPDPKAQRRRTNPRKPAVVKFLNTWFADVIDERGRLITHACSSHAEALKKAYELAVDYPAIEEAA